MMKVASLILLVAVFGFIVAGASAGHHDRGFASAEANAQAFAQGDEKACTETYTSTVAISDHCKTACSESESESFAK